MKSFLKKVALVPIIIIFILASLWAGLPFSNAEEPESEEQVFYYLHDHLGGIETVVDEDGNVV